MKTLENMRQYTKEIPKYGDVMHIKTWKEATESGMITKYDGIGYWAKDGKMSNDSVFSTGQKDATHAVWFNK